MAKRSHSEFAEPSGNGEHTSKKKVKVPDALSQISERADDLIECLQALKSQKAEKADQALIQRLAKMSNELLPSFKALGKAQDEKMAEEDVPLPKSEGPEKHRQEPEVPVLTPWSPSEIAKDIPPIPAVLDPALEKASFTHAGVAAKHGERSYEQLEWLGDAYLYLMSTAYIYLTFPHLPHGEMCHIREVLVRNATLGDYAKHYGFDKRAIFPVEYDLDGRKGGTKVNAKERAKVLGDIFEAHVAAIILGDPIAGVSRTASWMKALWSTTIHEYIRKRTQPQPPLITPLMASASSSMMPVPVASTSPAVDFPTGKAKEKLSAELALLKPRVQIEYRTIDESRKNRDPLTKLPLFTQGAFLVGYGEPDVRLGVGTAKKKVEANEKAAENALGNKKLIGVYKEKKRLAMEKQRAQEEAAKSLGL
ncbi:Ribonuclease 3 [Cytospora mali]|uniref:Ribonuclease 3 n=1 Tax=Cytospora mali TaxID=578113 RepID=A0A194WCE3_CYTMA|nr:Ribonuclease 3 [Valsa mali]